MTSSFIAQPIQSTSDLLVDVSYEAIEGNVQSTETIAELSQNTNTSLENLQYDWTSRPQSTRNYTPPGQTSTLWQLFQTAQQNGTSALNTFISTYLDNPSGVSVLNHISANFLDGILLAVEGEEQNGTSSANTANNKMCGSMISTINSLITETNSTAANQTQPVQSDAKTCDTLQQQGQSAMQNDASVGQIGNDLTQTQLGLLTAYA